MIAALVPVKRLGVGKSRLRPPLDEARSGELAAAMLEDVLEALAGVGALGARAVVTGDPAVARVAEAAGARVILHPDDGLSPSIDAGAAALAAAGATAVLVVLGDVAGATARDLAELPAALAELGGRGVVLAPSRDGGTSALLRAPHDAIASAFGPDSAARHRALARAAGLPFRELALPSLAVDVDDAASLDAFLAGGEGGPRTRALLARIGWRGAA
jgi:2-phospho-L-lactate guanylyltransferase